MPARRLRCRDCKVRLNASNCSASYLAARKSHCRSCSSGQRRARRIENPGRERARERVRSVARAAEHRLRNYGITQETHDSLIAFLAGRCAICERQPPPDDVLCVDHDHATKRIRGLLCRRCNLALGAFQDSTAILRAAIHYLIDPPAERL